MITQQPPRSIPVVKCPSCGQPVRWEPASAWRPFCSKRCRVQDLGAWASGEYRIPVVEQDDGEDGIGN